MPFSVTNTVTYGCNNCGRIFSCKDSATMNLTVKLHNKKCKRDKATNMEVLTRKKSDEITPFSTKINRKQKDTTIVRDVFE